MPLVGYKRSLEDLVKHVKYAEEIGFDSIQIADDFGFRDVFAVLAVMGMETNKVTISPITNFYSRNPALVAMGIATVDEISNGRARLGLVAGGSMTLRPLCIPMWNRPIRTLIEGIEICERLFRGETVDYDGDIFKLRGARLQVRSLRETIPIYVAARGPQMLKTAGMFAHGVMLGDIPESRFDFAIKQVEKGAKKSGRSLKEIKLSGGVTFVTGTKEKFSKFLKWRVANILLDTPSDVLERAQIDPKVMKTIKEIKSCGDVDKAARLVTLDMAKLYQIVNTPNECIERAQELVKKGINEIRIILPSGTEDQALPILKNDVIPEIKSL